MKRYVLIAISMVCMIAATGCGKSKVQNSIADRTTRGETNQAPEVTATPTPAATPYEDMDESTTLEDYLQATQEDFNAAYGDGNDSEPAVNNAADSSEELYKEEDATVLNQGEAIYIKEKMFITQINDIYYNAADYLGKTVELEGIFETYHFDDTDLDYHYVVRYGPGCCSNDGSAGFEIKWADDSKQYPEQNAWIHVKGVLESYKEGEYEYLRLKLVEMEELKERGEEYVAQ